MGEVFCVFSASLRWLPRIGLRAVELADGLVLLDAKLNGW